MLQPIDHETQKQKFQEMMQTQLYKEQEETNRKDSATEELLESVSMSKKPSL